jgi:hypothetical protein
MEPAQSEKGQEPEEASEDAKMMTIKIQTNGEDEAADTAGIMAKDLAMAGVGVIVLMTN